jgi:hypothetical protein
MDDPEGEPVVHHETSTVTDMEPSDETTPEKDPHKKKTMETEKDDGKSNIQV